MKVDLTTVLNKRCDTLTVDYSFNAAELDGAVSFPYGITLSSPVSVKGKVTDNNNCMFLNVTVTAQYRTLCDRCLDDIEGIVSFDFKRMISTESVVSEDDDTVFVVESAIDVDCDIVEELALELPFYHLCKEDCKGMCQKCGKNLNFGPCECSEQKEIDPRLKKFQKLLDNFE